MANTLSDDVETFLLEGENFTKKQEGVSTYIQSNCLLKVDDDGFFLLWSFTENEVNAIECNHIKEVSNRIPLKDVKGFAGFNNGDGDITNRVLTVYYGFEIGSLSLMQFIASSSEQAEKWVNALNKIVHHLDAHFLSPLAIMRKQWKRLCYSSTAKGKIPMRRLAKHFGHDKNEKVILQKLKSCGFSYTKNEEISPQDFTFEVYKKIHKNLCARKDLDELFTEVVGGKFDHVKLSQLVQWLNNNQRDPRLNEILAPPFDDKKTRAIIAKYESSPDNRKADRLSKQGFFDYLASDDNRLVHRDHIITAHDMDRPLNHYFINSSHNTYLTGFQWKGKSSVDIYRHALLSGYRCIELDCWDGKDGEPIITHGKAMCTDVVFKNVLIAIRDSAFVTSDYPVILSFETHCSKPLQLKMAQYCEEIFGDMLLGKPFDDYPLEPGIPLPSPNKLRRKILIKNKRLDPEVEKAQLENLSRNKDYVLDDEPEEAHPELEESKADGDSPVIKDESINNNDEPKSPDIQIDQLQQDSFKSRPSFKKSQSNASNEDDEMDLSNYEYIKTSATNIHPNLSALVNYCQSIKFPGFKKLDENQKRCFQMSSFSESVGLNYLKSNAIDFVVYNRSQLSRIYPKGARVDSSNYMPQIFWNAGCQMVSLNAQNNDLGVQLNTEKFKYNRKSGYLLKPEVLLTKNNFDPFAESSFDGVIAAQCVVKIISSQFLFDRPISSTVQVQMYGLPTDTIRKEFRTAAVPGNALNPIYKDNNEFLFHQIICPDLALLRFVVTDDNKQLVAQRVVPLNSLQTGYRYVTLNTVSSDPYDSAMVFVKITLMSFVPDNHFQIATALVNPKAHASMTKQHSEQLRCLEDDDDEDEESSGGSSSTPDEVPVVDYQQRNGRNGSNKTLKNKSISKSRVKEQVSMKASNASSVQGSVHSKPEEKVGIEDLVQESPQTLEELYLHPIYLKTIESFKREYAKRSKKLAKKSGTVNKGGGQSGQCCGLTRIFSKRRKNENNSNNLKVDENSLLDVQSPDLSIERKNTALLNTLQSIHDEIKEKLKKIQESEMNDLSQDQTKKWMDSSKQLKKDKTIPPAERERRLRDSKSQNIKSFTETRQTMKNRHFKQSDRLETLLKEEFAKLEKEINKDSKKNAIDLIEKESIEKNCTF